MNQTKYVRNTAINLTGLLCHFDIYYHDTSDDWFFLTKSQRVTETEATLVVSLHVSVLTNVAICLLHGVRTLFRLLCENSTPQTTVFTADVGGCLNCWQDRDA